MNDRNNGKASAKKQGEGGGTFRDFWGIKRIHGNENEFARPDGLRENPETVI